jgi:hypothetical protein
VPTMHPGVATALALLLGAGMGANPSARPPAIPPAPLPALPPTASSASAPSASSNPLPAAIVAEPNAEPGPYSPPSRTRESGCTVEVHRQAFREYGISYPEARGAYEVDHLIPLELGGDNTFANLWPESAEPTPGFHQKYNTTDCMDVIVKILGLFGGAVLFLWAI